MVHRFTKATKRANFRVVVDSINADAVLRSRLISQVNTECTTVVALVLDYHQGLVHHINRLR
jgi:hypothetical protein